MSVTSETESERKEFTWKIANFKALTAVNPHLKNVAYFFEAGHTIGLPSKWKVYLTTTDRDGNIGIKLKILEFPKGIEKVKANFKYDSRRYFVDEFNLPFEYTPSSKSNGWNNALFDLRNSYAYDEHLEGGNLIIKITMNIFAGEEDPRKYKRAKFHHETRDMVVQDLQTLLDSGEHSDITIETTDGQSLKAHSFILETRSPALFAEFESQMTQSGTKEVRVEDLGFEGMKTMLKFIYTGEVGHNWGEVIEEITVAAKKYELKLLRDFCDQNLASICQPDSAWDLMKFALIHELKTADGEITQYIEYHLREIVQAGKSAVAN